MKKEKRLLPCLKARRGRRPLSLQGRGIPPWWRAPGESTRRGKLSGLFKFGRGLLVAVAVPVACDCKTRPTINGTPLRRVERDGRRLSAVRALNRHLDALANARLLRRGDGWEPVVLRLLAGIATLRLVLQTLVVKEELFANRPVELLAAINATNQSILKLDIGL